MSTKAFKSKVRAFKSKMRTFPINKKTIWGISIVGIIFMLWIGHGLYRTIIQSMNPPEGLIKVQTVHAKEAAMPEMIDTIGTMVAEKEIKIKSGGVGRVLSLEVESGSWVNAGTQLIKIVAAPEVRAPFDGYLTDWHVKVGEYVQPGTELIELVNTNILNLMYKVPEQFASKLDNDQVVELWVKAHPEKLFKGKVTFISPVVDKKTYTIRIKATVENPNQDLWPGMSAHVKHILHDNPNAIVIPESALILTFEGHEVLVVEKDTLVKRKVQVGNRRNGRAQILTGLQKGEEVIITRTMVTREGVKVTKEEWLGDW